MNTMTRFSEFFESKLNKLITFPTGPARRAFLALALALTVGTAGAQGTSFMGSKKTGATTETKVVLIDKSGSTTNIGSSLKSFVESLNLTGEVYARLYVSSDINGTLATDQTVATFSGIDDWNKFGGYGYIYKGSKLASAVENISVKSMVKSNIALVVGTDLTGLVYKYIGGKAWRIARENGPNYGTGSPYNPTQNWQCPVNDKAGTGIYDDRLYFYGDTYDYDCGPDGKTLVHGNTTWGAGTEQDVTTVGSTSGKPWKIETDTDGQMYLVLPYGGGFPFICCDTQYNGPARYLIEEMSADRLVLTYNDTDAHDISWRWVFTCDDLDEVLANYESYSQPSTNLLSGVNWDAVTTWTSDGFSPTINCASGVVTIDLPTARSGDWNSQLGVSLGLNASNMKNYILRAKLKATKNVSGLLFKIDHVDRGNPDRVNLTAGEEYSVKRVILGGAEEITNYSVQIYADLGTYEAGTQIQFYDIDLEELPQDTKNLFNPSTISSYWTWGADGDPAITITYNEAKRSYSFNVGASYPKGDAWNAGFGFSTSAGITKGKKYDFSCVIRPAADLSDVAVNVEDMGDNNKKLFERTLPVTLTGGRDYAFVLNDITATEDITAKLNIAIGKAAANSDITIRNVVLKEHVDNTDITAITREPDWDAQLVLWDLANADKTGYTESSKIVNTGGNETSVTIAMNTTTSVMPNEKALDLKYMHWSLTDLDGNVIPVNDGSGYTLTLSGEGITFISDNEIATSFGPYMRSAETKKLDDVSFSVSVPTGKKISDYLVVGTLSTDEGTLGDGGYGQEPQIDARVRLGFEINPFVPTTSNISKPKADGGPIVKYKDVPFDASALKLSPRLFANWREVVADAGSTPNDFPNEGYARWYLEDTNGNLINMISFEAAVDTYKDKGQYGKYHYRFDGSKFQKSGYPDNTDYDPVITLPATLPDGTATSTNYKKVRLVCVVTTSATESPLPEQESAKIKAKYIFIPYTQTDYDNQPFVHSMGEGYNETRNLTERGYIIKSSTTPQYSFDYDSGACNAATGDIRQSVHTVEYNLYLNLADGAKQEIVPSFQGYIGTKADGSDPDNWWDASNTEPFGYLRWYDWDTDMHSANLEKISIYDGGNEMFILDDYKDRGLMGFNLSEARRRKHNDGWVRFTPRYIGVKFVAPSGFSSRTEPINIALDVSRNIDGVSADFKTLIHEPTIGVRYIYHIYPASVVSNAIKANLESPTETRLPAAETNLKNGSWVYKNLTIAQKHNMFDLYEDNGRVVVTLNGDTYDDAVGQKYKAGQFSLRMNLPTVGNYFIDNGETPVQAAQAQWQMYYEDVNGLWKKDDLTTATNSRIGVYSLDDFSGNYTLLATGEAQTKPVQARPGMTFHAVAVVSNGTLSAPVAHYELQFINSKPEPVGSESANRTEDFLKEKYVHGATLHFDEYFSADEDERYAEPTTGEKNFARIPLQWDDAQYSFCYPQLYGENGNVYQMTHAEGWQGWGISPLHADYTLLKSMNRPGVSESRAVNNDYSFSQTYTTWWYQTKLLYDVTHAKDPSKYGTYLYVDAADESRTIAKINFKAQGMCSGSELYFTAYIADMTDGDGEAPQVLFRVSVMKDGKKVPVVSFHSADLNSTLLSGVRDASTAGTDPRAKWYQVYGFATIPAGMDLPYDEDGYSTFMVDIDNYATTTAGADYCVDEISFYTCPAQIQVNMESAYCVDDKVKTSIYIEASNLQSSALGISDTDQYLYYRVCDYETDEVVKGVYNMGGTTGTYGYVKVKTNYSESDLVNDPSKVGFYRGADDIIYYRLAYGQLPLEAGRKYYVSIYNIDAYKNVEGHEMVDTDTAWGSPKKHCTTYSQPFTAFKVYVQLTDVDGKAINEVTANCEGFTSIKMNAEMRMPNQETETSGYTVFKSLHFDYFIGSFARYKSLDDSENLNDAIADYREQIPSGVGFDAKKYQQKIDAAVAAAASSEQAALRTKLEGYLKTLQKYADDELLIFSNSNEFEYELIEPGQYEFVAIPQEKFVEMDLNGKDSNGRSPGETGYNSNSSVNTETGMTTVSVCFPISFGVNYTNTYPSMELGFEDVDYPANSWRGVRLGLEQLNNLQKTTDGYVLHIPVHDFSVTGKARNTVTLKLDGALTLYGTNDPSVPKLVQDGETDDYIAANQNLKLATFETGAVVDNDHQYISLNFASGVDAFTFHEGYEYKAKITFHDSADGETVTCPSTMLVTLKVVPAYLTWNATAANDNPNWLYDDNWTRSIKSELYSATYQNNSEIVTGGTNDYTTYVPMKFTYVTLPTGDKAPHLANLTVVADNTADDITNKTRRKGLYQSTLAGDNVSVATKNIEYDMLVRYGEDGCHSHPTNGDPFTAEGTNIYDCEKFRANYCREIYFKPGAELINQQYLIYNKAWVEKELAAAKWSLMATPLKDTYSGDMYVPSATGKQATEAFKNISFNTTDYSRTAYPIYQRSWGDDFDSNVYVATNDTYRSDFTANLPFTAVTADMAEWSHTFNNVNVAYTDRTGFAIRAHKEGTGTARIRLPKADTSYSYYSWNGTETTPQTGTASATLTKTNANKFVTDETTDGAVKINVGSLQKVGDYVLVGNPYMASLKMSEFFKENTGITTKSYQTYSDGAVTTAASTGVIRPLQAFFVQVPSDVTSLNFTKAMMIDGNHESDVDPTSDGGGARRYMSISAANEHGSSAANVRIDTQASDGFVVNEDVETLFDSNLAEVPMVYTVAGQQAVSIDVRPAFELLPFGVVCAANNEPVSVTFNEAELLGEPLYVVDGATGEATPVNSGDAYEVQPNDYGRYFLSTRGDLTAIERTEVVNGIVISVRGRQVTVHAPSALESVRAITTNGIAAYSTTVGTTDTSFTLNANGIYIIEAQTADTTKTVKVVVK